MDILSTNTKWRTMLLGKRINTIMAKITEIKNIPLEEGKLVSDFENILSKIMENLNLS